MKCRLLEIAFGSGAHWSTTVGVRRKMEDGDKKDKTGKKKEKMSPISETKKYKNLIITKLFSMVRDMSEKASKHQSPS